MDLNKIWVGLLLGEGDNSHFVIFGVWFREAFSLIWDTLFFFRFLLSFISTCFVVYTAVSLLTTRKTYTNIKILDYIVILGDDTCVEQKSNRTREFAHTRVLSGDGRASEQLNLAKIRETYIVYNSHVTCSNSSFSLVMVTPTSHFFAFHWLCCLFPIGYMPKSTSVGGRICHHHRIQPCP